MDGLIATQESFRGIGYHKARALFGEDIAAIFKELNDSYVYISVYGRLRPDAAGYEPDKYWYHVNLTVEIADRLPSLFKPYVYFGDHKQT